MRKLTVILALLALSASPCLAEDLKEIFKRVDEFVVKNNYPKALEELTWAKKEIEKMHSTKLREFLPDQLAGYTGAKVETNNVLGISNLERRYSKPGDNSTIMVSITGGTGGGNSPFSGLAALGSMAAMMGQQEGAETFRIAGRTANLTVNEAGGNGELSIFLDSGSILKVEMNGTANGAALKTMAEGIKIDDLDKYLKGVS